MLSEKEANYEKDLTNLYKLAYDQRGRGVPNNNQYRKWTIPFSELLQFEFAWFSWVR